MNKDELILKLVNRKLLRMKDEDYLKVKYRYKTGKELNLDNPTTFNEKMQWLKIHDRNPEYIKMVDKYEVKKYVSDMIGEEYIIPTLGVYDKFDEINFEKLPNQFVIKCTHDSGGIVICKDKTQLDIKATKNKINECLKKNYYYNAREWVYKDIKPRIIVEKYMEDESKKELKDYKFFCFNGEAKYIQVDFDRFTNHKRNIYDTNWNLTDIQILYPRHENIKIDRPQKLELMLELAGKLARGKKFVRVDFYSIIQNVYFGELTFYPGAGMEKFTPEKYDKLWGDLLVLPIDR